ncbi:Rh-associated glycoprotein [Capsaspora owczarzaki ATCC 30864]|uniref:Rh-associated glycoprotein n=1 Tax=Capsaspora owczarzaki (strain ATCC 30864) TaxID=595528 RepID=A0A0D2UHU9_CAPO3|nr:Rh-associated glycoprotein [Capsaspora owczarzaki ATCC 30864]KJE94671.1 Rh-associated glycoprotein [Capsaspora owczarzaki ATCC 30864]|eukprot:XP_004346969.1 Rh-associated glycoprotein [Capsaspora owczarzaki ATCC 30864]
MSSSERKPLIAGGAGASINSDRDGPVYSSQSLHQQQQPKQRHPHHLGSPSASAYLSTKSLVRISLPEPDKAIDDHTRRWFGRDGLGSFGAIQVAMIALYAAFTDYDKTSDLPVYGFEKDVSIMIFVGFGFLMTFLKKFGYGAVGFTFLVSAFCIEWAILVTRFFSQASNNSFGTILLNESDLTNGQFGAAAVMISFGALLGKVSSDQMFWLAFLEIIFYGLNIFVGSLKLKALDVGGTIFIHTFGAYFGLAASWVLSPDPKKRSYVDNSNSYHSDIFSFIGTTFLWILWPSFNAALAAPGQQQIITINTVLSLVGSCVCSFYASRLLRGEGRFEVVDIQNATLAGGVAIGAVSNLCVSPAGALAVGSVAGVVSCAGYIWTQPWLQKKISLYDTCGVHNLHGMPGLIGCAASVIATAAQANFAGPAGQAYPQSTQYAYQLAAIGITLAIAISSGIFSAHVIQRLIPSERVLFTDELYWTVPTSEVTFSKGDINPNVRRAVSSRQKRALTIARWNLVRASIGNKGNMLGIVKHAAAAKRLSSLRQNSNE